jgi:hypothetical protein
MVRLLSICLVAMRPSLIAVFFAALPFSARTLSYVTADAQTISVGSVLPATTWYDSTIAPRTERAGTRWLMSPPAERYAPVVSAIIPGGGQFMLRNDRFVGYLAVEIVSWWKYAKDASEQSAQEAEFKDLARQVARAHFTTGSPDALPDANWAYYEKMRDYLESGSYSLAVSGPVVPETDVTTYNGSRWQLALNTSTTRDAALQQYMQTAVRPEFEWSWKNAQFQYDRFKRTTDKRNDAYRAGVSDLMVIGANHVLSMIDAFTTIRLRASPDAAGGARIGATVKW